MDVELSGLTAARHGRTVLDIPSLRFGRARTTAILGPNGAGKTTLLRIIAGLESPAAGEVRLDGVPVRGIGRRTNGEGPLAAFVFQEQVFLRRSVRENLELGLRIAGMASDERRARVEDAAARLGIAHLLERNAHQISGGEGRRVSLARALCLRAPLVLLDEPLEGVDAPTYARLLDELPSLLAAFNATTLLVTHSRDEALRLADDLVVLVQGRVLAAGDKHAVAGKPRVRAVAEALGYPVLTRGGRMVAVPPGSLRCGPGETTFDLVVEHVVDTVDSLEIVGLIGDVRVRVPVPPAAVRPAPGTEMQVHARRVFELASASAEGDILSRTRHA